MSVATVSLSPAPSGSIHSPARSSNPVRSAVAPGARVPTSAERRMAAAGAVVVAATTSARLIPQCSSFDSVVAWSYTGPATLCACRSLDTVSGGKSCANAARATR